MQIPKYFREFDAQCRKVDRDKCFFIANVEGKDLYRWCLGGEFYFVSGSTENTYHVLDDYQKDRPEKPWITLLEDKSVEELAKWFTNAVDIKNSL